MKTELIEKILEKYLLWEEVKTTEQVESNKNESNKNESVFIWKYVILRCRNAGVHFGKLEYASNGVYRLSESRRLYYWKNIKWISLSETALYWIDDDSKVCAVINLIEITEREWWEIIPCSSEAIKSIQEKVNYIN